LEGISGDHLVYTVNKTRPNLDQVAQDLVRANFGCGWSSICSSNNKTQTKFSLPRQTKWYCGCRANQKKQQ